MGFNHLPMHAPRDPAVDLLPRTVNRATPLARRPAVIFPAADPAYRRLADRLTAAGFAVEAVPAKLFASAKRETYTIYVADKTG